LYPYRYVGIDFSLHSLFVKVTIPRKVGTCIGTASPQVESHTTVFSQIARGLSPNTRHPPVTHHLRNPSKPQSVRTFQTHFEQATGIRASLVGDRKTAEPNRPTAPD
jgi:hypothetical protein